MVEGETAPAAGIVPGAHLRAAFVQAPTGLAVLDASHRVVEANPALERLLGGELAGRSLSDHARDPAELAAGLRGLDRSRSVRFDLELQGGRWVQVAASPFAVDDRVGVLLQLQDVSDRKIEEQRLEHRATHDALTGLPNHTVLHSRLSRVLERGSSAAVLFLDLDRFKLVNDSLGHAAGDQLLRQVSQRISDALRPADLVARLAGDEFVVLCEDVGETVAHEVAQRILASLRPPVHLQEGGPLSPVSSIGIRLTEDGDTLEAVIRDADTAMYAAKAAGGNRAEVFTPALRSQVVRRHEVEVALRAAVPRGDLRLEYQPIVDAAGRATALEALLRWTGPGGEVSPVELVAVAEQGDLVHEVGEWVLSRALTDAAVLPAALRVHVNVSPRQLVPSFTVRVRELLERTGVAPQRVCLEITETAAERRVDDLAGHLHDLRALGVRLAIDDFGVGQASLTYLTRLPVHEVKIDRSFVTGLPDDTGSAAVVSAVIAMARAYGMPVIAEGVETALQHEAARLLGCAGTQGFLHAHPMPLDEARAWVARAHVVAPRRAALPRPRPAEPRPVGRG